MTKAATHMERTKAYNAALLLQTEELLAQLSDDDLAAPRGLLFGSSIGQHLRHIIEYYGLLLSQHPPGVTNYDKRQRDRRIETDVAHARDSIGRCVGLMSMLRADGPLVLESELPGDDAAVRQNTSLLRELTYVADHCVHHLAMVRIIVEQDLPHVCFPEELGVAAATRNHRAR